MRITGPAWVKGATTTVLLFLAPAAGWCQGGHAHGGQGGGPVAPMPPSRATPANLGLPREKAISPFSPKAAGGLEGPKLGTVAAGYPARPVTVRPLKVSQTFSNKGTGKVPAGLGLADPVTDGLNSIGDLVTKPAPTIGTGIGQILTGGKGLHPNTQDTDSGPPNSPGNGQRPGQPQSLHAANQAQAQKWSASQAQTQFRTAKNNYYAAKDA